MAGVTLKELVKTYDNGHQAVKGIDLTIDDGEFVVLVGPSGCGKSTILRSIAGLESITSGEINLGDRRIDDLNPAKRDIAMVFQNYALYPHMSVYKNLAYGLKNRGVDKDTIHSKVMDAAAMLKIEEYLDRKPQQLSGGQRQRVAMGRAIVRNPQLFLFDEPLSNLDAKLRAHMRLEIKKLQRNLGTTSIFVTHDQVEAMTLADRLVVLNGGKIEQVGTPKEVYDHPASLFVASFMGSPAMNFLETVYQGDGVTEIPGGGQFNIPVNGEIEAGRSLVVGIRPEEVELMEPDRVSDNSVIPFNVKITEELGASQLVHGDIGGQEFVANTRQNLTPQDSRKNHVQLDMQHMHLFDQATGRRVA